MKKKYIILATLAVITSLITIAQDVNKQTPPDDTDCLGKPFFIGEQKDYFVEIMGVHTQQKDTIGGKLLIWEHLGAKLYIDNNDKIIDYSFMKANPEADPKAKSKRK